jgi:hypothetical protein
VVLPLTPLQVIVYVVGDIRGGVAMVPDGGCVPLQPPEASQLCTFAAFHCNVTGVPISTLLSLAFRLRVGGAMGVTAASAVLVKLFDDTPELHAVSALSTANPRIDFHRSPWQTRRLQ